MEKLIVHALVRDLNANFDVGLGTDPITVPDPEFQDLIGSPRHVRQHPDRMGPGVEEKEAGLLSEA
jgi:hypothetical protein